MFEHNYAGHTSLTHIPKSVKTGKITISIQNINFWHFNPVCPIWLWLLLVLIIFFFSLFFFPKSYHANVRKNFCRYEINRILKRSWGEATLTKTLRKPFEWNNTYVFQTKIHVNPNVRFSIFIFITPVELIVWIFRC